MMFPSTTDYIYDVAEKSLSPSNVIAIATSEGYALPCICGEAGINKPTMLTVI